MDFGMSQGDMESIQGGLDPSGATGGTTSDFSTGDPSLGDNDYTVTNTPTEFRTVENYTQARGATSRNPYPESIFSRMFGAENVNYTNILGPQGVAQVNNLRYSQGVNPSQFNAGDFYIGQNTIKGTVKPIPDMASNIMKFMPAGGIISAIIPQKGLPEGSKRYQDLMAEEARSANDPTIFDRTSDFVKSKLGFDPKDSGASLAVSPTGDGQFGVPDTRTFDAFGNVTGSDLDTEDRFKTIEELAEERKKQNAINAISDMFQAKPKYEQQADLSQTFRNINDATKGVLGPDGMPVPFFNNEDFRFKFGVDKKTQEPRATFTYNFDTV